MNNEIRFDGLIGVGSVELKLEPDQRVYALIGVNGVGKTKTLEALFQLLLLRHNECMQFVYRLQSNKFLYKAVHVDSIKTPIPVTRMILEHFSQANIPSHNCPVIFIASQNRGFIHHKSNNENTIKIGNFQQRKKNYFDQIIDGMSNSFANLNMNISIEDWFITLAQSANPYQKPEDNRKVEIDTVLRLLNQIDSRIDPEFLQISGDGRVSIKIENQLRELSHLSTGFASILKMIQAIVSGYGYFTNEINLQHVKGYVLIDEIESHLHLSWQAQIIPLLKKLFPNTTFYVTTHSSVVLSPLKDGEAYRLERDKDGVVRTKPIPSPTKASLVDVLKEAFDIDLNRIKLDNTQPSDQQKAKQQLLDLLNQGAA
ncbi:MAG: hypothetical protein RLZZ422_2267 [Pseudomonadota bacterium]|jgi:predicted ATP-binding protein involved in virulence